MPKCFMKVTRGRGREEEDCKEIHKTRKSNSKEIQAFRLSLRSKFKSYEQNINIDNVYTWPQVSFTDRYYIKKKEEDLSNSINNNDITKILKEYSSCASMGEEKNGRKTLQLPGFITDHRTKCESDDDEFQEKQEEYIGTVQSSDT